jgi:hypothetical protein
MGRLVDVGVPARRLGSVGRARNFAVAVAVAMVVVGMLVDGGFVVVGTCERRKVHVDVSSEAADAPFQWGSRMTVVQSE